jgi:CHAT domain-containing protein/Tfp pilus assembly protein PilF
VRCIIRAFHVLALREEVVPDLETSWSAWKRLQGGALFAALCAAPLAHADDGAARRAALREKGRSYEHQNRLTEAEQAYAAALEDAERRVPGTLALADALHDRAEIASTRGQLDVAEELHGRAVVLRRQLAPDSLALAASLTGHGKVLFARGRAEPARALFEEARAIQERLAPDSLALAHTINTIAIEVFFRGDLAAAEALHRRSLALAEAHPGDSLELASALDSLGVIASQRGDLAAAQEHHGRALGVMERIAPGSLGLARVLSHLGNVAWYRHDVDRAEDLYKRSMAIREVLAPDSLSLAAAWSALGLVARTRESYPLAEERYRKALAIQEARAPGSWAVATTLINLGMIARARGLLEEATDLYRRALVIDEKLAPDSLAVADVLSALGELALTRGQDADAEERLQQARGLFARLAPDTSSEATALYRLAQLRRRNGRLREALELLELSLGALEAQAERLGGGSEERSGFAASFHDQYRAQVEVLLALGEPEKAFHSLERSRARGLLEMMARREASLTGEVPAELQEQRRQIGTEYDRILETLGSLNVAKDRARIDELHASLRDLRARSQALGGALRGASPRQAHWRYPEPVDAGRARAALDPGTLLLSYSTGADHTLLFALSGDGLGVHTLPVGEAALREEVARFRKALRGPSADADQRGQAAGLFERLVRPAEEAVGRAERVVICPDGPLHTLPWGALVRPAGPGRKEQWLVEWKPVHVVVSATVYSEVRRGRPADGSARWPTTLVAFGDADYSSASPPPAAPDAQAFPARQRERGWSLAPLPASRHEVERIRQIFAGSGGEVRAYVGAEATEDKVRAVGRGVRYLHLACHAFADEDSPLDSSLVLTLPRAPGAGQANGWLQAWEIMNDLELGADLVTLSACESGLGSERRGEGLVGLARAFQLAGARSVVASLWKVGDASTAVLMEDFYRHLRAGKSKDQALRQAQLSLLRGARRDRRRPFHWAAFQLIGDWN